MPPINNTTKSSQDKLCRLEEYLSGLGNVIVAFSGGIDSTFLLKAAQNALGDKVVAVTVKPYSFPGRELEEAEAFCREMGIQHFTIGFNEFDIKGFSENPPDRCYLCKKELFGKVKEMAAKKNIPYILEGSNLDDNKDYRPGMAAIKELGIISPLIKTGFYKEEIRRFAKEMGLKAWNKPSLACLSSRFAYGERITKEKLLMADKAEQLLAGKGFLQARVRIHGQMARIEVMPDEFEKLIRKDIREEIISGLKSYGFTYISMDLEGYRTGSMNEMLD